MQGNSHTEAEPESMQFDTHQLNRLYCDDTPDVLKMSLPPPRDHVTYSSFSREHPCIKVIVHDMDLAACNACGYIYFHLISNKENCTRFPLGF